MPSNDVHSEELRKIVIDVQNIYVGEVPLKNKVTPQFITNIAYFVEEYTANAVREARIDAEISQAEAIKRVYELYSHEATNFYKALCKAIENKKKKRESDRIQSLNKDNNVNAKSNKGVN